MGLSRVLKHRAVLHRIEATGERIEGERTEFEVHSPEFLCFYIAAGTRESGRGGQRTEQPQLMFLGVDVFGDALVLHAEDELELTSAPGLDADSLGRYQVDGEPQWLGRPGSPPKAILVALRRARGHRPGA